jgi:sugar O-acyltransferase (sialic acid O-acetyltransferase NeuD family)
MDKIIIAGISGHSKVLIDIVEKERKYEIVGLTDKFHSQDAKVLGYRVLGKDEDIPQIVKAYSIVGGLIGVGDNWLRYNISKKIEDIYPEFRFVKAIHPSAQIAKDVTIGDGTVIMGGVIVNPCSSISRFCILNTNSSLDHDSMMGDFSSLAPQATTGGNCRIGNYSAVSIGAILSHGIQVGEHTIIGAGSTVLNNIKPFKVAYGTPAKAIREREQGDKYL